MTTYSLKESCKRELFCEAQAAMIVEQLMTTHLGRDDDPSGKRSHWVYLGALVVDPRSY